MERGYSVRNTVKFCIHEPTTARQRKFTCFVELNRGFPMLALVQFKG